MIRYIFFFCLLKLLCSSALLSQEKPDQPGLISASQLERLMVKPGCLEGYKPMQSGPLHKIDNTAGAPDDSTFTVEKIRVPSSGVMITGWLFLPLKGDKCPLIVLTNGGGDGSHPIKSLSEFIAPVFAHCGIAAFVHDKRGTGESEGVFAKSTYADFADDAGNCAVYLSGHKRINPSQVGIMGGSEGGITALMAACRFPRIKFVISFSGTVVTMVEDRLYAQTGWLKSTGLSDTVLNEILPLWKKSFLVWTSENKSDHEKINREIFEMRKKLNRDILPFTREEMESIPDFKPVLATWNSLSDDYPAELVHFNKKWLAVFGEADKVVPTETSIKNIQSYMSTSGNRQYNIAVIPRCGHVPVDVETKQRIRFENLILNWLNDNVLNCL